MWGVRKGTSIAIDDEGLFLGGSERTGLNGVYQCMKLAKTLWNEVGVGILPRKGGYASVDCIILGSVPVDPPDSRGYRYIP